MRRLSVLTWHVHGSYLYYLSHLPHDIYVPVKHGRPPGYTGLPVGGFPWPANLREIPADAVRDLRLDCVLFQAPSQWEREQHEILSAEQRRLPKIYLEHDPPRLHPTDTRHLVDDPDVLLVHVTPFNALMWDNGRASVRVIEHGVTVPEGVHYQGDRPRAIAVVNDIRTRGRRLGSDVLDAVRQCVPVDLVGLGSREAGGLGEVSHRDLFAFASRYRVFFNPIRYTSLGLAVCEAMMVGLPVVGLATTEMVTVVENGVSGFVDTSLDGVVAGLETLLADPPLAEWMGQHARQHALERFGIGRFVGDWESALSLVTGVPRAGTSGTGGDRPGPKVRVSA